MSAIPSFFVSAYLLGAVLTSTAIGLRELVDSIIWGRACLKAAEDNRPGPPEFHGVSLPAMYRKTLLWPIYLWRGR